MPLNDEDDGLVPLDGREVFEVLGLIVLAGALLGLLMFAGVMLHSALRVWAS